MSGQDVVVMPMCRADVPAVAKWTEEWLGAAHPLAYSLTIFSSPGYTNFLLNQQAIGGPVKLIGAYDGDDMLGFIELRHMPDQLFINNFCVKGEARGRRIGEALLRYTEKLVREIGVSTVGLDCFSWNERALRKYIASGFQETDSIQWLTSQNDRGRAGVPVEFSVEERRKADVHQQAFGFSQFRVQSKNRLLTVNRLKEDYFRVTANEQNPDYYNILSQIDRRRSLFMIRSGADKVEGSWNKASDSVRLEKQIH